MLALYSSYNNTIVTNPAFMRIPVFDKLNLGHGVFDTANVYNGHIY